MATFTTDILGRGRLLALASRCRGLFFISTACIILFILRHYCIASILPSRRLGATRPRRRGFITPRMIGRITDDDEAISSAKAPHFESDATIFELGNARFLGNATSTRRRTHQMCLFYMIA